jgi:hypothetical protein
MGLTSNSVIYGEEKGKWPYCYYCDDCTAVVACHPNTYNPMGFMATSAVRRLRQKVHRLLDPIWENNFLSRSDAYDWLANQLSIAPSECHISHFNKSQLDLAISVLSVHAKNDYIQFQRRKTKNDARRNARNDRQNSRIVRRKSRE